MWIETDNYVDVATASRMLGVTGRRVSAICNTGRLGETVRVGHTRLIPREAVANFQRLPPGRKSKREQTEKLISDALAQSKATTKEI